MDWPLFNCKDSPEYESLKLFRDTLVSVPSFAVNRAAGFFFCCGDAIGGGVAVPPSSPIVFAVSILERAPGFPFAPPWGYTTTSSPVAAVNRAAIPVNTPGNVVQKLCLSESAKSSPPLGMTECSCREFYAAPDGLASRKPGSWKGIQECAEDNDACEMQQRSQMPRNQMRRIVFMRGKSC